MTLTTLTGPAAEPVLLDEAKAHLRVVSSDEDDLIARLISTARQHVETQAGLVLITQQLRHTRDRWPPGGGVPLPVHPVQSVEAVRVYGADEAFAQLDPAHTHLAKAGRPARLVLRAGRQWPRPGRSHGGIEIDLTAGFGPAPHDVPGPLRQAVLLLLAHWFEHREPAGAEPEPLPHMVSALLAPYRWVGLS